MNPHICLPVTHNKRQGTYTIGGLTSIWYISLISFSVFAFRSSFEVYMCVIVFGWPEGLILKDCRSGAISSSGVNTRTYRGWEHIMEWLHVKTHLYGSICWWDGRTEKKTDVLKRHYYSFPPSFAYFFPLFDVFPKSLITKVIILSFLHNLLSGWMMRKSVNATCVLMETKTVSWPCVYKMWFTGRRILKW